MRRKVFKISFITVAVSILLLFCFVWGMRPKESIDSEEGVKYVIGVSQANMRESWRLVLMEEMENALEDYGNIHLITKDATSDVDKQQQDIDRLLGFGIDLLIVLPCDTKAMADKIKEVYDSNIPVIVMDRAIEGFDYTLYLGPDNEMIGMQAGKYIAALMDEKEGHPEITQKQLCIKNELKDSAFDAVLQGKGELRDVDAVFAYNDQIALGVYEALKELGMEQDIAIVGSDGFTGKEGGIDLVKSGKIEATISCPTGGKEAIEYALDILNNESGVPKQVILRSHTITADTVGEYLDKMDRLYVDDGREITVGYSQVGQESQWRLANTQSIKSADSCDHVGPECKFGKWERGFDHHVYRGGFY